MCKRKVKKVMGLLQNSSLKERVYSVGETPTDRIIEINLPEVSSLREGFFSRRSLPAAGSQSYNYR